MQIPFLKPEELFGDYNVKFWPRKDKNLFTLYLSGVSSAIPYTNHNVIARVVKEVQGIIEMAKSGLLPPREAINLVHKPNLFTTEELESIEEECESQGYIMGEFFRHDKEPSN